MPPNEALMMWPGFPMIRAPIAPPHNHRHFKGKGVKNNPEFTARSGIRAKNAHQNKYYSEYSTHWRCRFPSLIMALVVALRRLRPEFTYTSSMAYQRSKRVAWQG